MADAIAIAADLPFRAQLVEFILHLSRSLPNATEAINKDLLAQFEAQVKTEDPNAEIPEENRREVVKALVAKVAELRGAMEGLKDADAESSHLLLQHLISSNFDTSSEEYKSLVKSVIESVKKAGEAAWATKRITRHEQACRVLNNTYNYLPSSSPLRPVALLSLITLLGLSSDLKSLSLTPSNLSAAISQWDISNEEKSSFLSSAAAIYAQARETRKSLELSLIAIEQLQAGSHVVEKALIYAIADEKRYTVDDVVRAPGVQEKLEGKTAELVALFQGDVAEGGKKGQEWVAANQSWIEGQNVPSFTAEGVLRKLRAIALVQLASESSNQQLSYSDISSALQVDSSEVEVYVIDAIRDNLLKARLSQPTSTVRILSVSSVASRNFGAAEWQLLERRLQDWKKAIGNVKVVVDEAEAIAAQGPITNRPSGPRQDKGRRENRENRENREQREQREPREPREQREQAREEVAA
ncbi:hypothetical protein DB88DRAFT_499930 [Papiliotrema laurentii]|uniref:PCI domain-containing protein n=1 Tax=Papiliotrema laurentii TaxID=5418 RepID=A0AAD9CSN9_PAPLA|nr:hypothetical protein DB88DRAFT_499930 [Papiliotrema laurentii]